MHGLVVLALTGLLLGCSGSRLSVHPVSYPWRCGVPRPGCHLLGYEVSTLDETEAIHAANLVCDDGLYAVVPNPATRKSLIVCR